MMEIVILVHDPVKKRPRRWGTPGPLTSGNNPG
jgi:hypothetical protein